MDPTDTDLLSSPRPSRAIRALMLLGLPLALMLFGAWPRERFDPVETASVLLAQSLLADGDRTLDPEDNRRILAWRDASPSTVSGDSRRELEGVDEDIPYPRLAASGNGEFGVPLAYGLYLAPFVAVGGVVGAYLGHGLLVVGLFALLGAYWRPRLFDDTPWVLALFFVASGLLPASLHLRPEFFLGVVAVVLFALLYQGEALLGTSPEMYDDGKLRGGGVLARWLAIGALFAVLVVSASWLVALLVPIAATARRRRVGVSVLGAALLTMAVVGFLLLGSARLPALFPGLGTLDPRLWGWNLAYLAAGRHLGLGLYFAPLFLLLPWCGRAVGRRSLVAGVGLALVLLLWWQPHDLGGLPWTVGAGSLVVLYPVLLFLVDRPPRRWAAVITLAVAGAVFWPAWLHLRLPPADAQGRPLRVPPYFSPWLPWETTQSDLAAESSVSLSGLEVRVLNLAAWRGDDGGLRVLGGNWAELLLVSDAPVTGLRVEVEEQGGADIELRGAELRQTVLRPDGSVGFLLSVEEPRVWHIMPGSSGARYFRILTLNLPKAPRHPIRIGLGGVETAFLGDPSEDGTD
ncbi:MAG: hypothetical protein K8J08_03720 [Thermoanaerobaculia bacterium]|nr:hypothetical protein [Thermoanaerobaculia bacterium]